MLLKVEPRALPTVYVPGNTARHYSVYAHTLNETICPSPFQRLNLALPTDCMHMKITLDSTLFMHILYEYDVNENVCLTHSIPAG